MSGAVPITLPLTRPGNASRFNDGLGPPNLVRGTPELTRLWLAFQMINLFGLPFLVFTFIFSKRVVRHITLINACAVWMLVGLYSLILFFTGSQFGPEPPKAICLAQTSLIFSVLPMVSLSVFSLFFQVWSGATGIVLAADYPRLRTFALIAPPYLVMAFVTVITALVSTSIPQFVNRRRRFFYCTVDFDPLTKALSIFTSTVFALSIALLIHVAIIVFRNLRQFKGTGQLHYIIRMFLLGLYLMMAFTLSIISIWSVSSPAPDLAAAATGSVLLLFFGTQKDVLLEWRRIVLFWQYREVLTLPQPGAYNGAFKTSLESGRTAVEDPIQLKSYA